MADPQPGGNWRMQERPPLMTRRYEFATYAETRKFLDDLAVLSERTGYFPDLNFGKTYVNVSVAPRDETFGAAEYSFTAQTDNLAAQLGG
ncbi:MAG: 4a-hydroxytetrahydrobiopterin dehydratase [Pseudomonadota bacterium]|nr:4a-hydroxytetrahydrobiopterin dehydratase [Pseudomonadota bacterium]